MIQKTIVFVASCSQVPICKVTREITQFFKTKKGERGPKNLFYRVSHNTGHLKIWLSPRPFIKSGTQKIFRCPVRVYKGTGTQPNFLGVRCRETPCSSAVTWLGREGSITLSLREITATSTCSRSQLCRNNVDQAVNITQMFSKIFNLRNGNDSVTSSLHIQESHR